MVLEGGLEHLVDEVQVAGDRQPVLVALDPPDGDALARSGQRGRLLGRRPAGSSAARCGAWCSRRRPATAAGRCPRRTGSRRAGSRRSRAARRSPRPAPRPRRRARRRSRAASSIDAVDVQHHHGAARCPVVDDRSTRAACPSGSTASSWRRVQDAGPATSDSIASRSTDAEPVYASRSAPRSATRTSRSSSSGTRTVHPGGSPSGRGIGRLLDVGGHRPILPEPATQPTQRLAVADDVAEHAVDERGRLVGGEVAHQVQRLGDGDGVGHVVDVQHLEGRQPQHVAVHGRHPVERPVLGVGRRSPRRAGPVLGDALDQLARCTR